MPLRKPVTESEDKKAPTRPWEKKGASANPWQPDYLRIVKKRPGYRPRWVPYSNVEQKQLQGWQIASPSDYGLTDKHASDAKAVDSKIQRRELVLMEIPEDMARDREAYMEEKSKQARRAAKREVIQEAERANREYRQQGGEGNVVNVIDEGKDSEEGN